jgi:hypothetical protein
LAWKFYSLCKGNVDIQSLLLARHAKTVIR